MKTIEELRSEFEEIQRIKEILSCCEMSFDGGEYVEDVFANDPNECYINGAWFMFQELKK